MSRKKFDTSSIQPIEVEIDGKVWAVRSPLTQSILREVDAKSTGKDPDLTGALALLIKDAESKDFDDLDISLLIGIVKFITEEKNAQMEGKGVDPTTGS